MTSADARPIPLKNTAYRLTACIYDQEGDLVSAAAGLDSEVSIDGGAFADCTAEATEIGSSGFYTLDLTAAEMNGDTIAVQIKTSTVGAKTTALVMYPAENTDIPVNVTAISGDAVAADNLESDYDGNGYSKPASSIGTTTNLTTNNDKTGYALSGAGVTAVQSGLSTLTAAQVNTEVDTGLSDVGLTPTVTGRIDAAISSRLASASYTAPDNASVATILTRTDVATSTRLATAGYTAPDNAGIDAIEAIVGVALDATVSSRATPAQVNAEVVDALVTDTYAEPSAVPAATASLKDKLGWLVALARNKRTTTATTDTLRNDADNGNIATASVSDDGTSFIRGEYT